MFLAEQIKTEEKIDCLHCGSHCGTGSIETNGKHFCCSGCKTVYDILQEADLGKFYEIENQPGSRPSADKDYLVLDNKETAEKLYDFYSEEYAIITFKLPAIHCSSCIWLLEKLERLIPGIERSTVNFLKKQLTICFNPHEIKLSNIANKLNSLGYEPELSLAGTGERTKKDNRKLIWKLAMAGFCFGNVMLFTFPVYFGLSGGTHFKFFTYLNGLLALPVFTYCASDYWRSVKQALVHKKMTLDLPVLAGIIALAAQSYVEILSGSGEGYFDSLCGLLFFLLVGRFFQEKVTSHFSFERDFKSFFPLWTQKKVNGKYISSPVKEVKEGDQIRVINDELIPCDSSLISESVKIDYSFVTGESAPVTANKGEKVFCRRKSNQWRGQT